MAFYLIAIREVQVTCMLVPTACSCFPHAYTYHFMQVPLGPLQLMLWLYWLLPLLAGGITVCERGVGASHQRSQDVRAAGHLPASRHRRYVLQSSHAIRNAQQPTDIWTVCHGTVYQTMATRLRHIPRVCVCVCMCLLGFICPHNVYSGPHWLFNVSIPKDRCVVCHRVIMNHLFYPCAVYRTWGTNNMWTSIFMCYFQTVVVFRLSVAKLIVICFIMWRLSWSNHHISGCELDAKLWCLMFNSGTATANPVRGDILSDHRPWGYCLLLISLLKWMA